MILVMGLSVSFTANLTEKISINFSLDGGKLMEALIMTNYLAVSTGLSGVCSSGDFPMKVSMMFLMELVPRGSNPLDPAIYLFHIYN